MNIFEDGSYVMTPGGRARVVYHKMAHSDPNKVGYYAVRLDHSPSWERANTLYPANQITDIVLNYNYPIIKLIAAGLFARQDESFPNRIVGGTSKFYENVPDYLNPKLSNDIITYHDGFSITEIDSKFEISCTSSKGKLIDNTSYQSIHEAMDAIIALFK